MSNTIEIHCDTCERTYWFGQGRNLKDRDVTVFNSDRLGNFLYDHKGHILHTTDSDTQDQDCCEYEPDVYKYTQEDFDK